jgi:FlaA1/EpsC-like NDP-sugar epimerase
MMDSVEIADFIRKHVIERENSFFSEDIERFHDKISSHIFGKSVLVIGGAGTIGSAFIKALLPFKPARLYVIDVHENGLTELTRDLRSIPHQYIPEDFVTYPMDFASSAFKKVYLQEGGWDVVANFAAHKHVRSEKDRYAIEAMLENNVFKSKGLLDLLAIAPPSHFFCVSTDKATNPVNVMGASKLLMEMLLKAYGDKFKISTARFANVAFSNGSLLDGYLNRVYKKQPLSCPADIERYFISPEESGQICLLACLLGNSDEIFFPKFSVANLKSFKEITLAFCTLMGVKAIVCDSEDEAKKYTIQYGVEYPVYFFKSVTAGEKMAEEFYSPTDEVEFGKFSSLGIIKNHSGILVEDIDKILTQIHDLLSDPSTTKSEIINLLGSFLQEFQHQETGKSLDQQM